MSHKLLRLTSKYQDVPLLIEAKAADNIFTYLDSRNFETNATEMLAFSEKYDSREYTAIEENGVHLINLEGPLTYKSTGWEALCGGMSYEDLSARVDLALDNPNVNTILLAVNSGGGEAYGMMETANSIRKKADEAGVKIITYVDGMSASAAYGLASTSHEIIVNPEAEVGSIGVVVRLSNANKAMKEAGYETTYIYAGDNKIPFNKEGEFREEFLEDIQTKVDDLYGKFVSHVASARSLSEESVRATQAGVFSANKAVELGLADSVMEREEFFEYLAGLQDGTEMNFPKSKTKEVEMTTDVNEQVVALQAQLEEMQAEKAEMAAKATADAELLAELKAEREQLEAEKAAAKHAESVEKFKAYSFVEDAEKMASIAETLGEEAGVVVAAFDSAQEAIAEAGKVTEQEAEAQAELEEMAAPVSFAVESNEDADAAYKEAVKAKLK